MDETQAQISDLQNRVAQLEDFLAALLDSQLDEDEPEPVLESMHCRFIGRLKEKR